MDDDRTIELRETTFLELPRIVEMEQESGSGLVIPYALERHHEEFAKPETMYRSVYREAEMIGFAIVVLDADGTSVEFRRIVIAEAGKGYGTTVVRMIGEFCRRQLGRSRVWLDVFEANGRARRLYEKCGYRRFGRAEHEGRPLLLYETDI